MLPVEVIPEPAPAGETNTDPGQFSALNASSCCVEFRHGKMTLENPSPELLASPTCVNRSMVWASWYSTLSMRILSPGHLFIFRGRKGDTVKILWADTDGLCLFTKRLEEGQFIWPAVRDGKIAITRSQLAMLLDKLDWRQPKTTRFNSLTML